MPALSRGAARLGERRGARGRHHSGETRDRRSPPLGEPRAAATGGGAALNLAKLLSGITAPSLVVTVRPNALSPDSRRLGIARTTMRAPGLIASRRSPRPRAWLDRHRLDLLQARRAVGPLRLDCHGDMGVLPRERGDLPFDRDLPRHIVGRAAVVGERGARPGQSGGAHDMQALHELGPDALLLHRCAAV